MVFTRQMMEILINGEKVNIASPKEAIGAGVGMVNQHFTLVPTLTVAENIVLGYTNGLLLSQKDIEKSVAAAPKIRGGCRPLRDGKRPLSR